MATSRFSWEFRARGQDHPVAIIARIKARSPCGESYLIMPPIVVYFKREILMTELFSVSEAAAIAEVSPETIRTAMEKKSVAPSSKRKTGKAVRYQFSVGDVLLVKVLVEFPFALSQEDKQSLAKILSRGSRRAARWSREGADLVYRVGGRFQLNV